MGNLPVAAAAETEFANFNSNSYYVPPSPERCGVMSLTDENIAQYIEFPEDTFFMESISQNRVFDDSGIAYVPVQRFVNGTEETHVYTIRPGITEAEYLFGPVGAFDNSVPTTDVTVFGSALSNEGILYLAAWNRNSVIAYDLKNLPSNVDPGDAVLPLYEIEGLSAPNDISIDPADPTVLYVAGGTLKQFLGCNLGIPHCLKFPNAVRGKVYKVHLLDTNDFQVDVVSKDHLTLAGIEVFQGIIWTAQLFDIFIGQTPANAATEKSSKTKVVWKGDDDNDSTSIFEACDDFVWLADNIDVYNNDTMLVPAFSTQPELLVDVVAKNTLLATLAILFVQIQTIFVRGETLKEGLEDPEVDLQFSFTYIQEGVDPAPVRLIFLSTNTTFDEDTPSCDNARHFEVDLVETRRNNPPRDIIDRETGEVLGQRHFFNEQVTHATHLRSGNNDGCVAFVNFEQPRILLLDERAFQ